MSTPWFDNRLSLGNILTIATVAVAIVAGWYQFDNRLALAEDRFDRQVRADDENRRRLEMRLDRIETDRDDLKTRIIRIEEKLVGQTDKLDRILRSVEANSEPRSWPSRN